MSPRLHARRSPRRRVALLIESSRGYGRGLFLGVGQYVRQHHDWSVQSEEWKWTDALPLWLKDWNGDGVIARIETPAMARLIQRLGLPAVDLRGTVQGFSFPLIDTDDQKVASLAAEHLLDRGFRHYAFCGFAGANYSDKRSHWFVHRLAQAAYKCHIYNPPGAAGRGPTIRHEKRGLLFQENLRDWLKSLPMPVGIMACNDIRGQQILNACRLADLSVPEQVAVIGVDNDHVLCELSDPPMTSVVPDTLRIGYEAASLLERMMDGHAPPNEPKLISPLGIDTRHSTEALAMDDRKLAAGVQLIRKRALDPITVDEVARAAGMSRRVFERRFARQVGRSPKAEIVRLRLERAKELLADTDWSLAEIAGRTGFKYGEYLHTVFTHKLGLTPGAFRRRRQLGGGSRTSDYD
jgi:LacI family transcriptional regulator